MIVMIEITQVSPEDIGEILTVQRMAYQEQARLINDYEIFPLTETLEEVHELFGRLVMLKAVGPDREILGSVRGRQEDGTCHVGRLFVRPGYQGCGIGTKLLSAIEAACPQPRYELFTSHLSVDNLRLYERQGYVRFKELPQEEGYNLVYLEKRRDDII